MTIEVITWNINVFTSSIESMTKKASFIKRMTSKDTIVCLQECDENFYQELLKSKIFDWCIFSLQLRKKGKFDTKNRTLGCIVAGNLPFSPIEISLLSDTPLPERNLVVTIKYEKTMFKVCSFHSLTGASYKRAKVVNFLTIADWLEARTMPMVFGIDANTPDQDHCDLGKSVWWWKEEPILFGDKASHDMKDSYRIFLKNNPRILDEIKLKRPNGPLAISYKRGKKNRISCRYDMIFISPEWETIDVKYLYEESIKHGSDHALVKSKLQLK